MTDADLKLIKKEMDKIIRQKLPLLREEVTRCVTINFCRRISFFSYRTAMHRAFEAPPLLLTSI